MKNLEQKNFVGIWKNRNILPNWNYQDNIEITIYSYDRFSIGIKDKGLLVEGQLEAHNLENDTFQLNIDGTAQSDEYLNLQGRMYMTIGDPPPSFVLTIPGYGERYFEQTRK
jgi:hypothetical protein